MAVRLLGRLWKFKFKLECEAILQGRERQGKLNCRPAQIRPHTHPLSRQGNIQGSGVAPPSS